MHHLQSSWKRKSNLYLRLLFILLIMGVLATRLIIWAAIERANALEAAANFSAATAYDISKMQSQFEVYADTLYSGRALFMTDTPVSRQMWTQFINDQDVVQRYPGVYGVSYVSAITRSQVPEATQQLNDNRLPSETQSIQVFPASHEEQLAVLMYVAPETVNQSVIGYDLLTDPERARTLEAACDTGLPQASEPLALMTDSKDLSSSVLIAMPVYTTRTQLSTTAERQADLKGYVVLALHTQPLLDAIFKTGSYKEMAATIAVAGHTIYQVGSVATPALIQTSTITVAGEMWQVSFQADATYGLSTMAKVASTLVFFSNFLFAAVLIAAVYLAIQVERRSPHPMAAKVDESQ